MRSIGFDSFGNEQRVGTDIDGNIILETRHADVEHILKRNHELRSMGHGNGKDMKLAASLPLSIVMKWKAEKGVDVFSPDPDQKKAARRLLNDHTNQMFRVWEGNL